MGRYSLLVKESTAAELERIPEKDLRRIIRRIEALGDMPRPRGCEKLSSLERYRVRLGDYRIVYSIDDVKRIVEIFKVGHRSEVYRGR
jgi:mRNA interferase RelE/StbE